MPPENKFKQIYNPHSNRLNNFDYSQNGAYFITICTKNREHYFGEILDGNMILNDVGRIVFNEIKNLLSQDENIILDECIVMPNHIHLIICISKISVETTIYRVSGHGTCDGDTINGCLYENKQHQDTINGCLYDHMNGGSLMKSKNLMLHKNHIGFMIRKIKGKTTFLIHRFINHEDNLFFAWQSNYYDRIIRNEDELQRIRKYIVENPIKWECDKNNVENIFM